MRLAECCFKVIKQLCNRNEKITGCYTCELQAWPSGDSVFPDYTNPRTAEWWTQMCLEFKDVLDYDGIWIVCLHYIFPPFF